MLDRINAVFPLRLLAFSACVLCLLVTAGSAADGALTTGSAVLLALSAALTMLGWHDMTQTK